MSKPATAATSKQRRDVPAAAHSRPCLAMGSLYPAKARALMWGRASLPESISLRSSDPYLIPASPAPFLRNLFLCEFQGSSESQQVSKQKP